MSIRQLLEAITKCYQELVPDPQSHLTFCPGLSESQLDEFAVIVGRPFPQDLRDLYLFADGMATRQAFELTQSVLVRNLDDFILVTDDELRGAIRMLFDYTHNVAEGAGAASLAAALKLKDQLRGKKVALDLSGGNLTAQTLSSILG